jgi:hypothetical protein
MECRYMKANSLEEDKVRRIQMKNGFGSMEHWMIYGLITGRCQTKRFRSFLWNMDTRVTLD